jgi:hypothetical protein
VIVPPLDRVAVLQEAAAAICKDCREGVHLYYSRADKHGLNEGWHHRWKLDPKKNYGSEWNDRCPADSIHRLKRMNGRRVGGGNTVKVVSPKSRKAGQLAGSNPAVDHQ